MGSAVSFCNEVTFTFGCYWLGADPVQWPTWESIYISCWASEPDIPQWDGFTILNPANKSRGAEFYDYAGTHWSLWVFYKGLRPHSGLSGRIVYICQVNSEYCRTFYDPELRVFRGKNSALCTAVSKFDLCHFYLSKSWNMSCLA